MTWLAKRINGGNAMSKERPAGHYPIMIMMLFALVFVQARGSTQDRTDIWKDFVDTLMNNRMTLDRIRPVAGASKETQMGYLNKIKEKASLKELRIEPKQYRVGNLVHFIVPLSYEAPQIDYVFSFVLEDDTWYFYSLEAMFIRLDKIGSLPTSVFPDISEKQKAIHREEIRTRDLVYQFNFFSKEKGRDFALNWFKDGHGYVSSAKIRVPFLPPQRAFILFLCWDEANLVGDNVTLIKLTDDEAVVRLETIYFFLYTASSHLKDQIVYEDYRRIFESIWQDRAEKAGWKLDIKYEGEYPGQICIFHFTK